MSLGVGHLSNRFSFKHHWGRKENSLGIVGKRFRHRQQLHFVTQLYSNNYYQESRPRQGPTLHNTLDLHSTFFF